jgi:hypothetical protein
MALGHSSRRVIRFITILNHLPPTLYHQLIALLNKNRVTLSFSKKETFTPSNENLMNLKETAKIKVSLSLSLSLLLYTRP